MKSRLYCWLCFISLSFLVLTFFFPCRLFPFSVRCQVYTGRASQLILPEQQWHTGSVQNFFFKVIHIYVWEGNRDSWKEFQWSWASLGSCAMWEADWDCKPSYMCSPKSHDTVTSWSQPARDGFQPVFFILFFVPWELMTFSGNFGTCFLSLLPWFLS